MDSHEPLLCVEHLTTVFDTPSGIVKAVDDVSFDVRAGETLGLVGESGSGKSVTALSIMRLVKPPGRIAAGRIVFNGRDLLSLSEPAMRDVRGKDIGFIFQEPMTALNPVMTIGQQIAEALAVHHRASGADARARAVELLDAVRIPDARSRVNDHPHQLSGGMRQRAMIAIALACRPALVIADEPTTALDVTIQAEVLGLLREMKSAFHLSLLLITHDLGVVAQTADRVAVMQAGHIVESGEVLEVLRSPRHPYTADLLAARPGGARGPRRSRLRASRGGDAGSPPSRSGDAGAAASDFADADTDAAH